MNYLWGSLLISIHLRFHEIFFRPKFPLFAHATAFGLNFLIFVYEFSSFFYRFGFFYACLNFLCLKSGQCLPYFDTQKSLWLKLSAISFGPLTFGPREIWSLRNLGPRNLGPRNLVSEKFSPQEIWFQHENHFTAFLRPQISWGTNILGSKKA